jgi:polysaccharide export outer membrane protein
MRLHLRNVFLLFAAFLLFSCASRKTIVYLQDIDSKASYESLNYEPKLQPDDLLSIIVSAENAEVTVPFNLPQLESRNADISQEGKKYLIDYEGNIDFPVLGKIKLSGLTRTEATKKLSDAISEYILHPSIYLRILNFRVAVLGEVNKPGNYTIQGERVSVLDALGMAGDLTIYGKRDNILVIHEAEGKKTYSRIDLTNAAFMNTQSYYLAQNDIIVVEPNKTRVNSSVIGPNTSVVLAILPIAISIAVLLTR